MTSTDSNNNNNWLVYIIETRQGKLYTGITTDLARRMEQHRSGRGAKYFRLDPPVRVLWYEHNHNRSSASKREVEIKGFSRAAKLALIAQTPLSAIPI